MDAAFLSAAQLKPRIHRVLKLDLRPLTLGHVFLLHDIESPFVDDSREVTLAGLLTSTLICALPQRRARRFILSWRAKLFMRLWGFACRKSDWPVELAAFRAYWSQQNAVPAIETNGRSGPELRAPMHWRILVMLMHDFHMSPGEAMETEILKANLLWATEAERCGAVRLAWGGRMAQFWEEAHRLDLASLGEKN